MASATDSAHLCSLDCVPIYCPFADDFRCPAGLDFCPSMHQRMCVTDETPDARTQTPDGGSGGEALPSSGSDPSTTSR